jgi:hypothetical protein
MMTIKHAYVRSILFACLIVLLIFTTGCTAQTIAVTPSPLPTKTPLPPIAIPPTPTTIPRPPLLADEVKTISAEFERVSKAHIDAWNKHDTGLITQLYTDDIKYYEVGNIPNITGINGMLDILNMVFSGNPDYAASIEDTFIGHEDGFIFYKMWNWAERPQENPLLAFDRYILREGKIAEYWIFWDAKALAESFSGWQGAELDPKPLLDYASAWSSGDPKTVANMYSPYVERQDTLFGYDQQNSNAVKEFAADFFAWYPGVRLELLDSFKLRNSTPTFIGGMYAIHVTDQAGKPCDVHAIILLETIPDQIIKEWMYYNADSLIACGWAK